MKKYLSVFMLVSTVSVYSMGSDEDRVRQAFARGFQNYIAVQAARNTVLITTDDNVGQFRHQPTPRSVTPPLDDQSGGAAPQSTPWQSSRVRRASAPSGSFWLQLQKLPKWQQVTIRYVLAGVAGSGVGIIVNKLCQMIPEGVRFYCGCGTYADYARAFGW